jgi:hypothetical protein
MCSRHDVDEILLMVALNTNQRAIRYNAIKMKNVKWLLSNIVLYGTYSYEKKDYTVMVIDSNSTNINITNNHLLTELTEHQKEI